MEDHDWSFAVRTKLIPDIKKNIPNTPYVISFLISLSVALQKTWPVNMRLAIPSNVSNAPKILLMFMSFIFN